MAWRGDREDEGRAELFLKKARPGGTQERMKVGRMRYKKSQRMAGRGGEASKARREGLTWAAASEGRRIG